MNNANLSQLNKLGLEKYLDATKALHKGQGYSEFTAMVNAVDDKGKRMERKAIADAFGVSRYTIYAWMELYKNLKGGQA